MIKITYVTITYQAAKVVQRTLDSVHAQDYSEITHLIIDGASTDGTIEMVNDYIERSNAAGNGHKVLLMSEPDKGIYDAMNKGLRSLDGDYVCSLPFFMAIRILLMARETSCTIVVLLPRRTLHGSRSVTVCWSAIRLSMPVPILLSPLLIIRNTVTQPMLIGVSVS